jgi:hypothetical protein
MNKFLGASLLLIGLAMVDVTQAQAMAPAVHADDLKVVVIDAAPQLNAVHLMVPYAPLDLQMAVLTDAPALNPPTAATAQPGQARYAVAPASVALPGIRCHGPPRAPN